MDMVIAEGPGCLPSASHVKGDDVMVAADLAAVDRYLEMHPELQIEGSDHFVASVKASLGVMLSTLSGSGLLDDLCAAYEEKEWHLKITEKIGGPDGGRFYPASKTVELGLWVLNSDRGLNGGPLTGTPLLFLNHELVHAYQDATGGLPEGSSVFEKVETARNSEREATGLDWMDESGAVISGDALAYTDNKFRHELGTPERAQYASEEGQPLEWID